MPSLIALWLTLLAVTLSAQPLGIRPANHIVHTRGVLDDLLGGVNPSTSAAAVKNAADSFASDVAIVSNALNTLNYAPDTVNVLSLATQGFAAESDEDNHRAVLFAASSPDDRVAQDANDKIVENTPIVLDGLQSIIEDPSPVNVRRMVSRMQRAR